MSNSNIKTLLPDLYYRTLFENNVRPDGRDLWEVRPVAINTGSITTANGSALVKLGNTTILCGITAELSEPKPTEPTKGYIVPNLELPPLCSKNFKPGAPSEQAQVGTQFVADVITQSQCLNLEDLCIIPGKLVWCLFCNLTCLDYDGNANDAAIAALMAGLSNTLLPKVIYDENTSNVEVDLKQLEPIRVLSMPIASTVALIDETRIFADCTAEEEKLIRSIITVVVGQDQTVSVHKPGGCAVTQEMLDKCLAHAKQRTKIIRDLIEAAQENK